MRSGGPTGNKSSDAGITVLAGFVRIRSLPEYARILTDPATSRNFTQTRVKNRREMSIPLAQWLIVFPVSTIC